MTTIQFTEVPIDFDEARQNPGVLIIPSLEAIFPRGAVLHRRYAEFQAGYLTSWMFNCAMGTPKLETIPVHFAYSRWSTRKAIMVYNTVFGLYAAMRDRYITVNYIVNGNSEHRSIWGNPERDAATFQVRPGIKLGATEPRVQRRIVEHMSCGRTDQPLYVVRPFANDGGVKCFRVVFGQKPDDLKEVTS